jgi:hypothetical protein
VLLTVLHLLRETNPVVILGMRLRPCGRDEDRHSCRWRVYGKLCSNSAREGWLHSALKATKRRHLRAGG